MSPRVLHVEVMQALKENALRMVVHHREYCDAENCNISSHQVRMLIEAAGISMNDDEKNLCV